MIIANGTIEFKRKEGGGIDPDTGHPIPPREYWSCPVPCQFIPNENRQARTSDGEHYHQYTHEVLVEEMRVCATEQVRLRNWCGDVIGEYSIISFSPLEAVSEVRIII